jgi:hypothetical protein
MLFTKSRRTVEFKVGDRVRVKRRAHSPLAGEAGIVVKVSPMDVCGAYLVQFNQGLRFRYTVDELDLTTLRPEVFF